MRYLCFLIAMLGVAGPRAALAADPSPGDVEFFEKKIRPVLVEKCYQCHSAGAKKLKGSLYLDSREGALKGGETGAAVVPGKPGQSLLVKAVKYTDKDLQMPPKEQLSAAVVADLVKWVEIGAPWPGGGQVAVAGATTQPSTLNVAANYEHLEKELWSWQPVTNPAVPVVKNGEWAQDDIDRFVLAKLEEKGLEPSPRADKLALLRRATFDLTGLPPTPEEVEAFLNDDAPDAFAKVVDRLLASPRFGERWGRHWLDVARYAESSGMSRNYVYHYAWRYRDYVFDAFNRDVPYNRFVREQIAGDLLPAKTPEEKDRLEIATGFLAVGPRDFNEKNPRQFQMNVVDEQIDTMSRAILATTVACARCHDHKFDPIPTAEYYSLAGIFASSDEFLGVERRRMAAKQNPYSEKRLIALSGYKTSEAGEAKELDEDEVRAQARRTFGKLLVSAKLGGGYTKPMTAPKPLAMGVKDDARPTDIRVLVRGELDKPGDVVKRGFLTIPAVANPPAISTGESGRLELAIWLTRPDNPLTSRVMVNRIWQHLFGNGLVRSVDNFGMTGDKPTHPEMLDHLATRFVDGGWSVKKLVRSIMLSSTYQQSAAFDRAKYSIDPDNNLLWRMNQRRLEAEAIRDAMLSASGRLNATPPTGSVALDLPPVEIGRRINPSELLANMNFRSVYLPIFRNAVPEALEAFDFADPSQVNGARDVTTVAPQALYLLNNSFVTAQAQAMAYRVATYASARTDAARIDLAYRLALGRPASLAERERAASYLSNYMLDSNGSKGKSMDKTRLDALASFCQALFASAEFRYLN